MNINKKINQIEKKVSEQIDVMTMKNIEELNDEIYKFYNPYIEKINRIVEEVYSHTYMDIEDFEEYVNELIGTTKVFQEDERDNILLQLSQEAILRNKQILEDALDEMVDEFINQRICITQNRANLEWRKIQNTAISRVQRFLNLNYSEICKELRSISEFAYDSLIAYGSSRVITEVDKVEEIKEIEIELETNNRLFRTDNVYDIIELAISNGFREERQCGSHKIFKHSNGQILVIPFHGKTINVGLAFGLQKQIYEKIA